MARATQNDEQQVAVKKAAMMKERGPEIVKAVQDTMKAEVASRKYADKAQSLKFDVMARLTDSLLTIKSKDDGLDLEAVFDTDQKRTNALRTQVYVALGIKEYRPAAKTGSIRLFPVKEMSKHFPPEGADEKERATSVYAKKKSFQSNISRLIVAAAKSAVGMLDQGVQVQRRDEDKATLVITHAPAEIRGDEVAEDAEVVLDAVKAKGAKASPSFTTFANMAAQARNVGSDVGGRRPDAGEVAAQAAGDDEALGVLCNAMIVAVNALEGDLNGDQVRHLQSVRDAIAKRLEGEELIKADNKEIAA